jgi:hypothetical protein
MLVFWNKRGRFLSVFISEPDRQEWELGHWTIRNSIKADHVKRFHNRLVNFYNLLSLRPFRKNGDLKFRCSRSVYPSFSRNMSHTPWKRSDKRWKRKKNVYCCVPSADEDFLGLEAENTTWHVIWFSVEWWHVIWDKVLGHSIVRFHVRWGLDVRSHVRGRWKNVRSAAPIRFRSSFLRPEGHQVRSHVCGR